MLKEIARDVKATMGIYEAGPVYGILAEFPDPGALLHAAEAVRKAGYRHFDVHSPFPIHGMDKAMGMGQSKVGYITLGGGLTGLALGYWLQWWTAAVDYPINIGGKPFFAVEPSIPIIFELTVLFSAFGAVIGMFALNGLPRPYNPLFYSKNFARFSDDAFFLHVAASDGRFDRDQTAHLLRSLGGMNLELIEDREEVDVDESVVQRI
jgi:hypothetical protein